MNFYNLASLLVGDLAGYSLAKCNGIIAGGIKLRLGMATELAITQSRNGVKTFFHLLALEILQSPFSILHSHIFQFVYECFSYFHERNSINLFPTMEFRGGKEKEYLFQTFSGLL
ncbi:hypothetical protein Csa_017772 [Cucumis sativus]|uniref:Uncharacterized protein n=1 Tax=Cucumis sativus TaxID=3659 RepID=A0A0A0LMC0_CUCSA|nr:hypothetical protein Csa_017772 [Cucumis sativus]